MSNVSGSTKTLTDLTSAGPPVTSAQQRYSSPYTDISRVCANNTNFEKCMAVGGPEKDPVCMWNGRTSKCIAAEKVVKG